MPKFLIQKTLKIDCAHKLEGLPEGHQCGNLHGHTYKITVGLSAKTLDRNGWVVDFGDISAWIKQFDHKNLNDFFKPTTAEMFSSVIWDGLELEILNPLNEGIDPKKQILIEYVIVEETESNKVTLSR